MPKRYGCEAVDWEFKSERDLLLLMFCEDNKLSGCKGQRKLSTPKQNLKNQRKIKLQHVTCKSPKKNCAKKAHHKVKKKHHIAVPSRAWRSIFSGYQRCVNHSRDLHNISFSFWWPLWKINSFSLEAMWISHISHYWNSFCSLLS